MLKTRLMSNWCSGGKNGEDHLNFILDILTNIQENVPEFMERRNDFLFGCEAPYTTAAAAADH